MRILLADDSMTAQNMGKKILADAGYEVITVSNGAAAVKKIAENQPDLAILDVYMPGYTGLEVCERLKASPATAFLPVLLTVGKMEPFRPEEGNKVKADGVIIKPFEATDLVSVVQKLSERPRPASSGPSPLGPVAAAAAPAPAPVIDTPKHEEVTADGIDSAEMDIPLGTAEATLEQFETAAGTGDGSGEPELQTFMPADVPDNAETETSLELTAAAPVDVEEEPLIGLEPTIGTQSVELPPSTETLLDSFSGDNVVSETEPTAATHLEEPSLASELLDHEQAGSETTVDDPTDTPTQSWVAVEQTPNEEETNVDLQAEMLASGAKYTESLLGTEAGGCESAVEALGQETQGTKFSGEVNRSSASPLVAPLGKTSLDELDSVIEQAAARFETTPAINTAIVDKDVLLAEELESCAPTDSASMDAFWESETDRVETPLQAVDEISTESQGAAEPELVAEEHVAERKISASSTTNSDSLGGVFDIENLTAPSGPTAETATRKDSELVAEIPLEPAVEVPNTAPGVSPAADFPPEEPVAVALSNVDSVLPVEDFEPNLSEIRGSVTAPEAESNEMEFAEGVVQSSGDPAPSTHMAGSADSLAVDVPAVDDEAVNGVVERVVERVLDRLKPILSVMVEEILHELKNTK